MTRLENDPGASWAQLLFLGHLDHGCAEIRVIDPGGVRPALIGFFDDGNALIAAVSAAASGNVYLGVQPRPCGLMARSPNRLSPGVQGASSDEIEMLTTLMVDIDPIRARGAEKQAATDAELELALEAAKQASAWLERKGFIRPALAMSGNGAQLVFRVPPTPLDTDDRDALEQGAKLFEAEVRGHVETLALPVKIDRTSDFARVGKLIGTVSRKGDGRGDRPHRVSRWVDLPQTGPDELLLRHVMTLGVDELRRIDGERHRLGEGLQRRKASLPRKAAGESAELSNLERGQLWLEPVLADVRAHGHPHDGSRGTWRVSEHLTRGFCLSVGEALPLLREYVRGCSGPPWTDAELERKLNEALTRGKLPMGYLLDARRYERQPNGSASGVAPMRREGARDDDFGPLDAYDLDAVATTSASSEPSPQDDREGKAAVETAQIQNEPVPKKRAPKPSACDDSSRAALPPSGSGGSGEECGRPRIQLRNHPNEGHRELADVIDDAARVLGEHARDVYCRDGQLVDVGPVDIYLGRDGKKRRTAIAVGIRQLPSSEVQRQLSRCAIWGSWVKNQKTREWFEVETDPPISLANAVANMGRWSSVRPLDGVTTAPALRPDGTVLQEPGWDEITGYLYAPSESFPKVAESPTQAEAQAALAELREVFAPPGDGYEGFPYAGEADGFVPIAALLTLLARPAIDGPTPAFLFDAATPGSGKTLLADAICLIATGHEMPKGTFPEKPDELEKMLGGLALQGCAVAGFDNLDSRTPLRGAALDKVLTGRLVQMRVLGESRSPVLTWNAVTIVTGNNVSVQGDTIRRCIRSRQEPDCERPEERTNFRIEDLKGHVREHRPRLVCASLTLLRAFFVAGQPRSSAKPFGSFREWQRVVADAIAWAGGANVIDCRTDADEGDDPELEAAATLLGAMHRLGEAMSAGELVAAGYDLNSQGIPGSERSHDIREALDALVSRKDKNGRPTPKAVGWALKRIRGRVFSGLKLLSQPSGKGGKNVAWVARSGSDLGTSGDSGTFFYPLRGRACAGEASVTEVKELPKAPEVPESTPEGGQRVLFRGSFSGPRRVPS